MDRKSDKSVREMRCSEKIYAVCLTAMLLMAVSCAKDKSESSDDKQKRYLTSWLKYNGYGDAQPTATGMYILGETEGTGEVAVEDSIYVALNYDMAYLGSSYTGYNSDSIAKVMGTYAVTNRYKPHFWYIPDVSRQTRNALWGMKPGGKRRVILVPWQLDMETMERISGSSSDIYDNCYEVCGIVKDITAYQINELETFGKSHPAYTTDSLKYGIYVKQLETSAEYDTISFGTSVSVRYVGRYLDGQLFDTNVPDTAKRYGIYSGSDSDYSYLSVTFYKDSAQAISNNSSLVKGFAYSMSQMTRYGDHYVTYFFSDWGYGNSGSIKQATCSGIPGYTPLFFEIWIKKNS